MVSLLDILPAKRQNLLFSATLSEDVDQLIQTFFNAPHKIEVVPHGTPLDQIIQKGYVVPNFYTKSNLLKFLLSTDEEMKKVLVFVGTKRLADRLHEQISEDFPDQIGVIHSNKSQNYRINSVQQFETGTHRILVATEIIARGLDIYNITHVINFDIPEVPENYLHRIGRTGRADLAGIAISFISEREQEYQEGIEALMNKAIPMLPLPEEIEISEVLLEEEKTKLGGDKPYLKEPKLHASKGAFHEKLDKNKKVNRAQEKRMARLKEKQRSKRKKKK